jgi:DeoR family fructose operon transcriptional repressor
VIQPEEGARRLPAGRKAELAAYVAEVGEASVAKLAEKFDVSVDTIRRDLDSLDADGYLIRTHGGAVSVAASPKPEFGLDVRTRMQAGAKERIGAAAAALVSDGMVLLVNAGTTTLALVRHLGERRELTVATNSLRLPTEIAPEAVRDLYVFGGAVRIAAQATIGPIGFPAGAGTGDREIQADLALVGVGSVSEHGGYWTSNLAEAGMIRDMMQQSARVAVLADSTKLERRLFAQIAELGAADYLVTDAAPPPAMAAALAEAEVEVVVAG